MEDEFLTVKNPKGKADTWQHFGLQKNKRTGKITDNIAVCLKCNAVVKYSGGTTNLTSHLRRHHPMLSAETSTGRTSTLKETVKAEPKAQPTISQLFSARYPSTSDKSKLITNKIARFLVKDLRPYSMVESVEFKDMIRCLDPRYTVPTRKVFSEIVIPEMYETTKEMVQRSLLNAEQV